MWAWMTVPGAPGVSDMAAGHDSQHVKRTRSTEHTVRDGWEIPEQARPF